MGCSQSAAVLESAPKVARIQTPIPTINTTKSKMQYQQHYLLGNISENQFLFANVTNRAIKRMTIPEGIKPYNFSSMLEIQNKQFFISGGISYLLTDITPNACIYQSKNHTVKKVANMIFPRYTHAAIFSRSMVYVIGGRYFGQDQQAILRTCEKYSFQTNQWKIIAQLNVKRCTAYAIQWKKSIYVFGGYTGVFERSINIQRLDEKLNKWEIIDFTLNRGIQSAFVVCSGANQITIFGGNTNSGPTSAVVTINLLEKSILSHKSLKQEKTLHKSFAFLDQICIFGGSDKNILEVYNLQQNNSEVIDIKLNENFKPSTFEVLTQSEASIIVPYNQAKQPAYISSKQDQVVLIFGTTQQPFILQLNVSVPFSLFHAVPLSLKLYSYSGGISIQGSLSFIIFGGIQDDSLSNVSSQVYCYNHSTKQAKSLARIKTPRYSFSYKKLQQRIYAVGGGNMDIDGNLNILDQCQYYDLKTQNWKDISNLPKPLISSMSLVYSKKLYIFGGISYGNQRNKSIYQYNEITDKWIELNFHMPFGVQAAEIFSCKPSQFLIFGGRLDNGDSDGIWKLIFVQGSNSECSLINQGVLTEKKFGFRIFKPENQQFLVSFGGKKDVVTYYDLSTLKPIQWDGLRRLKEVFLSQIQTLNSLSMEKYLTISRS